VNIPHQLRSGVNCHEMMKNSSLLVRWILPIPKQKCSLAVGPTAKLHEAVTWESLAKMSPEQIRKAGLFPYPSLPHPKQQPGGQVFPQIQIEMFPRLQRFDVDFDLRSISSGISAVDLFTKQA
jgi:hypothetical protein